MSEPLWRPSPERVAAANMTAFRRVLAERHGVELADYASLHRWSVEHRAEFWSAVWSFCGIIGEGEAEGVLVDGERMPGARWFTRARLNFAENLLRRDDAATAIEFRGEDRVRRSLSFAELNAQVSRLAQALRAAGVGPGDRIAGYLPNMPEAIIAMLASAAIGAVWSSCSPDFGVQGVIDRFGQIAPRVLFCADGYFYAGKRVDSRDRVAAVVARIPSIEHVVMVPYTGKDPVAGVAGVTLADFTAGFPAKPLTFERFPFDHPLFILYSSGTTGAPKCMVHGAGGTLIQHLKEHRLHCDLRPDDRFFYFTTCGWMMWNWLASGLATGATLLLYDGSPFHPSGNVLFDFADEAGMTLLGTSAKFIDAVKKAELRPRCTHDLSALRTICSTGSPLAPESFDFVYEHIKSDVCLSSITGGTDLISCFALGNPTAPVWRGEIQCRGLGMAVEVYDEAGKPLRGRQGELVCERAFPSMPVGFWNDPDGRRYRAAYFERYPGVWHHGDYVTLTEHDGIVMHGRSDAVLNPGGVRIGTAEIYRQVEGMDQVLEALVIGQDWDNDVRVVLFVRLRDGLTLDEALIRAIKDHIRRSATPRHVPAKVIQVADIPRTRSGKIVELAVRDVVHEREVKNKEALANPEALALYAGVSELQS